MSSRNELLSIINYWCTNAAPDYPSTAEQILDAYRDEVLREASDKIRDRCRYYDPGEVQPIHVTVQDDADLIVPWEST